MSLSDLATKAHSSPSRRGSSHGGGEEFSKTAKDTTDVSSFACCTIHDSCSSMTSIKAEMTAAALGFVASSFADTDISGVIYWTIRLLRNEVPPSAHKREARMSLGRTDKFPRLCQGKYGHPKLLVGVKLQGTYLPDLRLDQSVEVEVVQ